MNAKKNIHAVALGKLGGAIGGKSTTDRKRAASKRNGRKGGRPRSQNIGDKTSVKPSMEGSKP